MTQVDITDAKITILVEVDGDVCAVTMDKDELETVSFIVKKYIKELIKTSRTQDELNKFILPTFFGGDNHAVDD